MSMDLTAYTLLGSIESALFVTIVFGVSKPHLLASESCRSLFSALYVSTGLLIHLTLSKIARFLTKALHWLL